MLRLAILVVMVALLGACGQPPREDEEDELSGFWGGMATLNLERLAPITYVSRLVVNSAGSIGSTATIANLCRDGSGSASITGEGGTAQWSGPVVCLPFAGGGCSAITVTLDHGTLSLEADGRLSVTGTGSSSGCGTTGWVALSFIGSK